MSWGLNKLWHHIWSALLQSPTHLLCLLLLKCNTFLYLLWLIPLRRSWISRHKVYATWWHLGPRVVKFAFVNTLNLSFSKYLHCFEAGNNLVCAETSESRPVKQETSHTYLQWYFPRLWVSSGLCKQPSSRYVLRNLQLKLLLCPSRAT